LFTEARGHLFFMESASIITLISIGHWVESKVSARAAKSLRALLNLTPPTARWLDPGGAEVEVPVSQLKAGDQVVIKPGDRVPIDSEVAEGASVVDESMLTGESTPVSKNKGARIYGGTVNLHGWLLGKVAAKAKPRRWRRLSPSCSAPKPAGPISKLGDRVSSVFRADCRVDRDWGGLLVGLAPESSACGQRVDRTFLWRAHHPARRMGGGDLSRVAVLINCVPCAMGLGQRPSQLWPAPTWPPNWNPEQGRVALEKTGRITSVLFDKTGTLTHGKMGIADSEDFLEPAEQAPRVP